MPTFRFLSSALGLLLLALFAGADRPAEVLEITQDTTLDPQKTYGPIVIRASGITLDGRRGAGWWGRARGADPGTIPSRTTS